MLTPRAPQALAKEAYDLIVVGGGVYGIMATLEAVRRGLRPLLIERGDFGAATSHNSLRILHGGLRYLQTLDLHRFRESVAERRWFLHHFPDLVRPLPCLAPLHGEGLHRPWIYAPALALNDLLSARRNAGLRGERALPGGTVLDAGATRALFPGVDSQGLVGGALWYDAFVPNAPRLLIETLHWACARGARVLNYVAGQAPLVEHGRIAGLRANDLIGGAELVPRAPVIINTAGPWAARFAAACGATVQTGLYQPSLAWNVLFDRTPPSSHALAARARGPGGRTYFLVPWKGALLAGTGHAPWDAGPDDPRLPRALLRTFIDDLNTAVPGLELAEGDVVRVLAGLLPAATAGTGDLAVRETILDHGRRGGPGGLFSVSGVKLTTSRRVADKVLARAFPSARPTPYSSFARPDRRAEHPDYPFAWMPAAGDNGWRDPLAHARRDEAVHHLDDLLLRRSSLGDNPVRAVALAEQTCALFGWNAERARREAEALRRALAPMVEEPGSG